MNLSQNKQERKMAEDNKKSQLEILLDNTERNVSDIFASSALPLKLKAELAQEINHAISKAYLKVNPLNNMDNK
jgi:hypothetical protein